MAAKSGRLILTAAALLAALSVAATPGGRAGAAVRPAPLPPPTCTGPDSYTEKVVAYTSQLANGQALDVDEFIPSGSGVPATVPGVVLIHGGQWTVGNFTAEAGDGMLPIGECLAANGYDAFAIDYALTLNGDGSFPENLQDINIAVGWLRNPANVPNLISDQLFALGTSAGGNLADLAGENAMGYTDNFAGVISQSGPSDLTTGGIGCGSTSGCAGDGSLVRTYLGCVDATSNTCTWWYEGSHTTGKSAATTYADASPANKASLSTTVPAPPFLLAGSTDEIIPLAQDTSMDQLLNTQCASTGGTTSDQLAALPGDQHAETYSDIMTGPVLGFLGAVTGGTLPSGCGTASPLTGAAMGYDANASADRTLLFGGCCTTSGTVSTALDSFNTATNTWTPVTVTSTAKPVPRLGASFGYDPVSGDLVLFGGENLPGGSKQPVALDDTWKLSYNSSTNQGAWTQADTGSGCPTACPASPSARYGASMDEAPANQGVVLYGGENIIPATSGGSPSADADTWLWNGTTSSWTQLSPSGSNPDAFYGAMLALDAPHNADVLFGGDNATSSCQTSCLNLVKDTWLLTYNSSAGTWTWTAEGAAPADMAAREFAAGASGTTSSSSGAVIFGGLAGNPPANGQPNDENLLGDTWTWNGATATWTEGCATCSPPASFGAGMAYQRNKTEDLLYGGFSQAAPAPPAQTWIWNGSWTGVNIRRG